MCNGRQIEGRLASRGISLDAVSRQIGISPTCLEKMIAGQPRPSAQQENAIRAAAGFAPLRACPTCNGYGPVGPNATEADPMLYLERGS